MNTAGPTVLPAPIQTDLYPIENKSKSSSSRLEAMSTGDIQILCYPSGLEEGMDPELRSVCAETNPQVIQNVSSRQGRENQRYSCDLSESEDGQTTGGCARMTTGTIPILNDGRILLISSSDGSSWVLPKGGWESDELLPVGAIRETFEEAGVVGLLDPPLPSMTYETRKSRKRRLAAASSGSLINLSPSAGSLSSVSDFGSTSVSHVSSMTNIERLVVTPESEESAPKDHTHNCLTMFPLYVTHVGDQWPEMHRKRRAFTIEEAEEALVERPEFVSVIRQAKLRQLHTRYLKDCEK